jgi:hypothetical protein
VGKLNRHEKPARKKGHLRRKDDAGHPGRGLEHVGLPDTGRRHRHQLGGEHHGDQRPCRSEGAEDAEDDGKHPPRLLLVPAEQVAGEDGDERNGEKSAGQHMVKYFRDGERDLVGVHVHPDPADESDTHFAHQPDDAAQKHRAHHDQRRDPDFLACG